MDDSVDDSIEVNSIIPKSDIPVALQYRGSGFLYFCFGCGMTAKTVVVEIHTLRVHHQVMNYMCNSHSQGFVTPQDLKE